LAGGSSGSREYITLSRRPTKVSSRARSRPSRGRHGPKDKARSS
jgi:hypothetical protein